MIINKGYLGDTGGLFTGQLVVSVTEAMGDQVPNGMYLVIQSPCFLN